MPSNYTSIIHANIPILECRPDPTRSSNLFRVIHSQLWVDDSCDISQISLSTIPIQLYMYFNDIIDIPEDNSLIAIQGIYFLLQSTTKMNNCILYLGMLFVRVEDEGIILVIRGFHIVQ